jgi:hypothetical protein
LPVGARAAVSRGLGGDQRNFFAKQTAPGVVLLNNPVQGLRATLSDGRLALSGARGLRFGLSSLAVGRGGSLVRIPLRGAGSLRQNKVVFSSPAAVSEWFANGPWGVEQGFELVRRPTGSGRLLISQMLSGNATGRVAAAGQSVTFSSPSGALRYEELDVTDATGTRIPARLSVAGRRLTITVADAHAVYPLRVDPEFQQSAELTASAGAASDELGYSLAVSGSTVAVGAPARDDYEGAVYVFTMPASGGWANATQTAELTASDGAPNDNLGWSVAVSGSTVVAGAALQAVGGNDSQGALYEWTMPAGGWANATQTTELTDSNGIANGDLGWSVAVSGSTIVAGAPGQGAAYEWTMPAGGWASATTQTAELSNPDADLGYSVAVSAPATTIVVGGVGYNDFSGAVYVYTLPASGGWANATQTAQLTASDGAANDYLGYSVAVSGSTIVSGTPFHDNSEGAVYEYTMPSAGGWVDATQTAELTASAGAAYDDLGWSVAVSAATIVAGAPDADNNLGAAFVYTRPASGVWGNATQSAELTSGGQFGQLGYSVAASGSTVFGGARGDSQGGAVYVFRPTVSGATVSLALSPQSIVANGTSTATATFTVGDTSGNPVTGDAVTITSSGGQTVGPVTEGSTPGTYLAQPIPRPLRTRVQPRR